MVTKLWTGVLLGAAATILVLGGLAVAGATAMGTGGGGMMMDGMMDECREMMEDHDHGHGSGEGHDHGDTNDTDSSGDDGDSIHAVALRSAR